MIKIHCDMLIDQNVYIGEDPIGHKCLNEAILTDGIYNICGECAKMICDQKQIHRITVTSKKYRMTAELGL